MNELERTKKWMEHQRVGGTAVGRILTVSPFVSADKLASVLVSFSGTLADTQEQEQA